MKFDGYFVECSKCGSYEVEYSEPTYNTRTGKGHLTWSCRECGHKVKKELKRKVRV